ncbi:hypothetical protein E0H38_33210 [Rhizobium leguminosarum bv. viciae]|nr:hypothetical protein E0H38_33210 [Rhizobium leguminosarum bv. viciae]
MFRQFKKKATEQSWEFREISAITVNMWVLMFSTPLELERHSVQSLNPEAGQGSVGGVEEQRRTLRRWEGRLGEIIGAQFLKGEPI